MIKNLRNRIGIGTAQFGMNYGINNITGVIPQNEVYEILNFALQYDIELLDTASSYGMSEKVIGNYPYRERFKIVSKFSNCKVNEIDNLLKTSLNYLKTDSIYGYLFHSFKDFKNNTELLQKLKDIQSLGKIRKLGFSLYLTAELDFLLDNDIEFEILQIPYNIFDRRFEDFLPILKSRNVEVHTRSVYLQGLIFRNLKELSPHFNDYKSKLLSLDEVANNLDVSKQELALNFCLSNKLIDKVIIGIDNLNQLKETILSVEKYDLINNNVSIFDKFKTEDEKFLLPFNWI
jgi:aryl-alcohol dehydrogenase-like predicted oxidoreductase